MERICPCCGKATVQPIASESPFRESHTLWECQWCYAIATLVAWDVTEDRIHAGFSCVSNEERGNLIILHLARNCDEAWEWVEENCPDADPSPTMNLN